MTSSRKSPPRAAKRHGHPLPASEEARGYLVPEGLQKEKGLGDDEPGGDGGEDPSGADKDPISGEGS